jgi:beta-barrel assembly-enhancing protease
MRSLIYPLALALGIGGVAACTKKQYIANEKAVAKALISDEQESAIGLALKEELAKEGIVYLDDPDVQAYVDAMGRKIFPLAAQDRKGIEWHAHVVADDETVNAFATPGGHLYLFTGLLLAADDEAEVAGVLAHEAGHVVARHSARAMVDMYGLQMLGALALGENPGLLKQLAANITATGLLLAHSREAEHEADVYGVKYAAKAGYDPRGISRFFKKLQAKQGKTPRALVWLSTHPATQDRINHVEELIHEKNLGGGQRNESRHAAIKEILRNPERRNVRGAEPVH